MTMAWTTVSGTNIGDWDQALLELMIAVDERYAVLGLGALTWPEPWGFGPALSDFVGVKIHGTSSETNVHEMIEDIQADIGVLTVGVFPVGKNIGWRKDSDVDPEGGNAWGSLNELLTDVGYGSDWVSLDRLSSKEIVLQLQGALDRMKYPVFRSARFYGSIEGVNPRARNLVQEGEDLVRLQSWHNAIADDAEWFIKTFGDPGRCGYLSNPLVPGQGFFSQRALRTETSADDGSWESPGEDYLGYAQAYYMEVVLTTSGADPLNSGGTLSFSSAGGEVWNLEDAPTDSPLFIETSAWQQLEAALEITSGTPPNAWWSSEDQALVTAYMNGQWAFADITEELTYG